MLAVVTVVLVAVGVVSVLSLSGYVTAMNDAELVESLHALNHSYTRYRDSAQTSTPTGNLPMSQAVLEFTGQTPGNLIAVLHDGVVIGSAVFSEDGHDPLRPTSSARSKRKCGTAARRVSKAWAAWAPTRLTAAPLAPIDCSSAYR